MDLRGKNVLITGGSIGIGLQLATKILDEGANVLICARNIPALEEAKKQFPRLEIAQCDVTQRDQVETLLKHAQALFGGIDLLINNAAVFRRFNILEEYPLEKQLEEIDINFKGPVILTNVFLPEMIKREEAMIVNLTSPSAYTSMAASQIYSATKSAIQSWTISIRHQLRETNVKVVELNPPAVDTRMNSFNPDLDGMKLMSPDRFAQVAIEGIKKGKEEILVSHSRIMKHLSRVMPGLAFRVVNKS
ncbi:MAG: SDR family NAD(P)-dependent oxidoreductase [Bacteroidota bacterium]